MARDDKNGCWIASEGANFATDPSANGSGFLPAITSSISKIQHGPELLETNYQNLRGFPTPRIVGPDSAAVDIDFDVTGLAAAAGDGVAPGADDYLDILFTHSMGSQTSVSGEGVGVGSTTTNVVLDTDVYGVQQFVPIFESGLPSSAPRTTWNFIETDGGTGSYGISHTQGFSYTTAGVAYGTKSYQFTDAGGNTVALYIREDDIGWTLLGSRCMKKQLIGEAGKKLILRTSWFADRRAQGIKASAPTILNPAVEPIQFRTSPFFWGATEIPIKSFTLDWGIKAKVVDASNGINGRGNIRLVRGAPSLSIMPEYLISLQNDRDAGTKRRIELQLGGGPLSGGVLNTCAVHALAAQVLKANAQGDDGLKRQSVDFEIVDLVEFSAGVAARLFQFYRS